MRHVTVSVDDETYRRICIKAAGRRTSGSALVRQFLFDLVGKESDFKELEKLERALRDRIVSFRASDRLARDEVHEAG